MLASIIITNHNYGKFVGECLRSCLNQSIDKSLFEVIVVDDCSTDNSVKVINEYLGHYKNLKLIRNKKNLGVAGSSNVGIRVAKGKYIVRVDSDDFINSELLRILSYFLEENNQYFCVGCDYYLVNIDGAKTDKISARDVPISCGVMYNAKVLKSIGLYNEKFRHREEEELRTRIIQNKNLKVFYLNFPLYRYRIHGTNKTKQKDYINKFKKKILLLNNKYHEYSKQKNKLLKNILVIIPAKGNSKRLKNKNILKIWGKPMLYWSIQAAKKSKFKNKIYVSSENEKILKYAKSQKVKTILRPHYLSQDNVFKMEVIRHALKEISKKLKPTLVISLQPNSPDIKSYEIDRGIEKLILEKLQEVVSVDENYNQNAAFRIMTYNTAKQRDLSTYQGFVITNSTDIHTSKDIKKLKKQY